MFVNKIHKTEKPEALAYIGLATMDMDGLVCGWMGRKIGGGEEWWIQRITGSAVHERLSTMRIHQNTNIRRSEETCGIDDRYGCYALLQTTAGDTSMAY
jgi:hypothetical protein